MLWISQFLNDRNRTGIGVYTYELVNTLLQIDRSDHFILFGISTFDTYEYLKNIDLKNFPNVEMKIQKLPARLFRRTFLAWQKLEYPPIEKFTGEVDIFHSFNWVLPPVKKAKNVATVFDMTALSNPQWHQERTSQLDKLRFKRISQKSDLVITISEHSKKDFEEFSPRSRVEVIYPAASELFTPKIDKQKTDKVLKKYQLKSGYFLSVATLEPRKNLQFLINNYLETNLSQPLVLVGGEGWKSQELKDLAAKYPNKIILTGFVDNDDLLIIYQQALALVYPSLYEGFGIPVLEAMSCGVPVITSNVSSLPEAGGDAALYIDPINDRELQRALIKMANNKKLRDSLIKKGLKQSKKFSWNFSAQKLKHSYQELLGEKV